MQVVHSIISGQLVELTLPSPDEEVVPGVTWGAFDELKTPAFWRCQAWQHDMLGTYSNLKLGRSLAEEVSACLLGGYGMPAELGLAAYSRLRSAGLLSQTPTANEIESALQEPLSCNGQLRTYRFVRQKSRYLSGCLVALQSFQEPDDDVVLRDALSTLPGVGLKTASWVVRNYRKSSAVAVLDVHILRACQYMGVFPSDWLPQKHYRELEHAFVSFARAIATPAMLLDGLMWDNMRRMPRAGLAPEIGRGSFRTGRKSRRSGQQRNTQLRLQLA